MRSVETHRSGGAANGFNARSLAALPEHMLHIAACRQASFWRPLSPPSGSSLPPFASAARIAQQAPTAIGVRLDRGLPHAAARRRSALLPVRHQPRSDARPQAPDSPSGARLPDGVRRHTAAAARPAGAARLRRQRLAADGRATASSCCTKPRAIFDAMIGAIETGTRVRLFQHLHLRRRPVGPAVCGGARRRRGTRRRCARAARRRRRVVFVAARERVATRHASALRAVSAAAALAADDQRQPAQSPQDPRRRRPRSLHGRHQHPRPVSRRARRLRGSSTRTFA